jgi:hypothetical protein
LETLAMRRNFDIVNEMNLPFLPQMP